jgi:hypothetical protein
MTGAADDLRNGSGPHPSLDASRLRDPPETGSPAWGIEKREETMKKLLVVLVAVFGLAGLGVVASAHMGGGGYPGPQGDGPRYGWNGGMGPGWMSHMGWMSRMGQMFDMDGRPYLGCGYYHSGRNYSAGPYTTGPRPGTTPEEGLKTPPGNSSPDIESGQ